MQQLFPILAAAEAVLIIILAALLAMKKRPAAGVQPSTHPFQKEPSLLSPAERAFHGVLESAVAGRYRVMVKVRMGDLIQVEGGVPAAERQLAEGAINSRHIDFVLCRPDDLRPETAIEVDDAGTEAIGRDAFVDAALGAAGLPLFRLSARQAWRVADLRAALKLAPAAGEKEGRMEHKGAEIFNPGPAPSCQVCGAEMVLRTIKRSDHTLDQFWGCINYPKCKASQPAREVQ